VYNANAGAAKASVAPIGDHESGNIDSLAQAGKIEG
jgi:hypothetical protein